MQGQAHWAFLAELIFDGGTETQAQADLLSGYSALSSSAKGRQALSPGPGNWLHDAASPNAPVKIARRRAETFLGPIWAILILSLAPARALLPLLLLAQIRIVLLQLSGIALQHQRFVTRPVSPSRCRSKLLPACEGRGASESTF